MKRRDAEQWMAHRMLPEKLRERIRRYEQYRWQETRGVEEESLIRSLPKDLRRDIKRHLCLDLLMRVSYCCCLPKCICNHVIYNVNHNMSLLQVPMFKKMDEQLLDAMCDRLKPVLYTENSFVVREGDPVDEMLFVMRGKLMSTTTNGGRTGFFNAVYLKAGDFCGEALLTWALDPQSSSNLPISTRTVQALDEVEAFALMADDLKFVASQFRRLHSKQIQHTFRHNSKPKFLTIIYFIQKSNLVIPLYFLLLGCIQCSGKRGQPALYNQLGAVAARRSLLSPYVKQKIDYKMHWQLRLEPQQALRLLSTLRNLLQIY